MTNRIRPGSGIGPTWRELIESGELQRILEYSRQDRKESRSMVERKPVFGKVPSNWSELTCEQKKEWARDFLRAAKKRLRGKNNQPHRPKDETHDEP
jgi:hypothetical protein